MQDAKGGELEGFEGRRPVEFPPSDEKWMRSFEATASRRSGKDHREDRSEVEGPHLATRPLVAEGRQPNGKKESRIRATDGGKCSLRELVMRLKVERFWSRDGERGVTCRNRGRT